MDQLFLSLRLDLTATAPDGPGWYVQATINGQMTVAPLGITPEAALEVSAAFQKALQSTEGELPQVALPQLVQSGSGLIRKALEEQLRYAEEQATKVGKLRKKLNTIMAAIPQENTNGQESR